MLQQPAVAQFPVHLGFKEADSAPPLALGAIQRRIGVRQQRRGIGAVIGINCNADAEADMGQIVVDLEFLADCLDQALGQRQHVFAPCVVGHQDHELIATDAGDEGAVGFRGKTLGGCPHHHIADGMAEHIVDVLEAVEIEAQHRKAGRRVLRAFQPLGERRVECAAVRQVGQRVMLRKVTDALLGVDALGHVLDYANEILRIA